MMPSHPAAEIFPLMIGTEFADLVADIAAHGLREAIVTHEGAILDGRNRYRACLEAEVDPHFTAWDGAGDAADYVLSKNLHRRHLNESQRAMIAAKMATLKAGDNQHSHREVRQICPTSKNNAAQRLKVSPRTVGNAKVVLREGTPEQVAAVEAGTTVPCPPLSARLDSAGH